jgi:hypothetical protein
MHCRLDVAVLALVIKAPGASPEGAIPRFPDG